MYRVQCPQSSQPCMSTRKTNACRICMIVQCKLDYQIDLAIIFSRLTRKHNKELHNPHNVIVTCTASRCTDLPISEHAGCRHLRNLATTQIQDPISTECDLHMIVYPKHIKEYNALNPWPQIESTRKNSECMYHQVC